MSSEWKEVQLGDVCESVSKTFNSKQDKVILINTSDVLDGKVTNHEYVSNKNLLGQFKKSFQRDDILYSEIRPKNRRFAYIDFEAKDYIASTKLMVIRAKNNVLPSFLYHILKSDKIIDQLQILAETRSGTFPQITFSELAALDICIPSIAEQQKISATLGIIDEKIDHNTLLNHHLEQTAQALFKSWFVDFEPWGGEMPGDWSEGCLGDITTINSGKRPSVKQEIKSNKVNIPLIGASSVMGYTDTILYNEKILITGRVGTHGVIQRFSSPCWTSDNTLVIKSNFYEFAYQLLQCIDFHNMNRGSTQPLITQTDLKNVPIILPDNKILNKYEEIAGSLMDYYGSNNDESSNLATLRDTLLPKLMSGELSVNEIN